MMWKKSNLSRINNLYTWFHSQSCFKTCPPFLTLSRKIFTLLNFSLFLVFSSTFWKYSQKWRSFQWQQTDLAVGRAQREGLDYIIIFVLPDPLGYLRDVGFVARFSTKPSVFSEIVLYQELLWQWRYKRARATTMTATETRNKRNIWEMG